MLKKKCELCGVRRTKLHTCIGCRKNGCGCCLHPTRAGRVCNVECGQVAKERGGFEFADGKDAFAHAKNQARYTHVNWIVWAVRGDGRESERRAAPLTQASLEA